MSIPYKTVLRKNPLDLSSPGKFYPQPVYGKRMEIVDLTDEIDRRSGVNRIDIIAVLEALTMVIPFYLASGNIVRLGEFGSFRMTLDSEGTPDEKDFVSAKISGMRMRFLSGSEVKKVMKTVTFDKVGEPAVIK